MKCARHTANKVFSTRAAPDFHECMRENVWNVACARPLSPTYQPKCSPCIWNVRMKCKRLREMKCSSGFCCMYVPLVRRVLYIWSDGCSRSTRNKWASSYGSFYPCYSLLIRSLPHAPLQIVRSICPTLSPSSIASGSLTRIGVIAIGFLFLSAPDRSQGICLEYSHLLVAGVRYFDQPK